MRKILVVAALFLAGASFTAAYALDSGAAAPVVVTPVKSTSVTSTGQAIVLPQGDVEVTASIFEIAPGAKLPVHKHPFPRYAYVLAGTLKVTSAETGKSDTFKAGDFIVEMIDQWHWGTNIGADQVKLLVVDQVVAGSQSTVLKQ
ncbi:cupin domain-containing protein [Mesorhizobium sp. KR9-304]|uniref:cupin domain-containing protein n=1 Tax=Mesorhizobium sp. KR9-304 TaxID=3156614 RepID=UPI0032B3A86E